MISLVGITSETASLLVRYMNWFYQNEHYLLSYHPIHFPSTPAAELTKWKIRVLPQLVEFLLSLLVLQREIMNLTF